MTALLALNLIQVTDARKIKFCERDICGSNVIKRKKVGL